MTSKSAKICVVKVSGKPWVNINELLVFVLVVLMLVLMLTLRFCGKFCNCALVEEDDSGPGATM